MKLSSEQISLMRWIKAQATPVSQQNMEDHQAPGYTSQRIETMVTVGLLDRSIAFNGSGNWYGVYQVSDKGSAALSETAQIADQQTKEEAQKIESMELQRKQTQIAERTYKAAVIQIAVSLGTFILGLFAEHYAGVLNWLFRLFQ